MMRTLFSFLMLIMMIFSVSHQAYALDLDGEKSTVAVVLDTPGGMFSEPEKVYTMVQESLDNIFKGAAQYKILPLGETDSYVQIYREENDLTLNMDTAVTGVTQRDLSLKKDDINKICKHFEADYVIYTRVTSTAPRVSIGFMSAGQKVNVTLDFRVWSDKKADFVYMKRTMTTGSSKTIYAGGMGSSSHAVEKGLKKGLEEIEKDSLKIKTSMIE